MDTEGQAANQTVFDSCFMHLRKLHPCVSSWPNIHLAIQ